MNFENVGLPAIKSFSLSKQSQFGQGSRAWDSKVKRTPEKVIPKIELLELAHQPQEFAIG
jgi:hypothetical protein